MTKDELIVAIHSRAGITQVEAGKAIDALQAYWVEQAKEGVELLLPGLGKVVTVERAARVSRNPRTGEAVAIPPKKALKFKVSVTLKRAVEKQD